jgi:hypothetical protein
MRTHMRSRGAPLLLAGALLLSVAPAALAHPDAGGPDDGSHDDHLHAPHDPSGPLVDHDDAVDHIISDAPNAKVTKNLAVVSHAERLGDNMTTDVWVHEDYAYLGTFNAPCGTGEGYGEDALVQNLEGPGVPIFDVHNKNKPTYVGSIPSVEGSRINDVKVMEMAQGDILVHSNEPCDEGPGGFEVYNVDDPTNPIHLAHVQVDDINLFLRDELGYSDVGVHNNFLFTRDGRDYNAVQAEGLLGSFQVFDITDPANIELVSWFGAEYVMDPTVDWVNLASDCDVEALGDCAGWPTILEAVNYLYSGYGNSANRFLHDQYVTPEGDLAYLAMWDEGLLLVDLGDLDGPATLISQALDVEAGSLDGEVNSHSVWPNADGSIVVEGEEDFSAWERLAPPGSLTFGSGDPAAPLPGSAISTVAGNAFEDSQTGNVGVLDEGLLTVTGGPLADESYAAIELAGDQPKLEDVGSVEGEIVFIGRACNGDELLNADQFTEDGVEIAVVRRGACTFREKNFNAASLGADAVVIANNVQVNTPWSGMRIWDYSDPENPVLASTFDTTCSVTTEPGGTCDPRGTYSSHNVIVEGDLAYISWYSEGVVVLDISDPYNPVEVARYHESGEEFEARNGGIQDVWGIYKVPNEPWIYASDRNGGLYILKAYGAGSAKQGKAPGKTAPGKAKGPKG